MPMEADTDGSFTRMLDGFGGTASRAYAQDAILNVQFDMGVILNDGKTAAAGRPVYDEIETVRIAVPGRMDYVVRPAWEQDRQRFAQQYAAFKQGLSAATSGTPLAMWPPIKKSQVAELSVAGVRTVEQLAAMSDIDAMKFMGNHELRAMAKDFLEAAKGAAPMVAMRHELQSRDAEINNLKAQMAQLVEAQTRAATPHEEVVLEPPPRRGRPPKAQQLDAE